LKDRKSVHHSFEFCSGSFDTYYYHERTWSYAAGITTVLFRTAFSVAEIPSWYHPHDNHKESVSTNSFTATAALAYGVLVIECALLSQFNHVLISHVLAIYYN
jgi:hypothetical protein